jgi:hypothetical protein
MLEQKYANQRSEIASYSWEQIASGLGIVTFYVSKFSDSVGNSWKMVQEQLYSGQNNAASTSLGSGETVVDLTPFNTPRTIQGTATVSCFGHVSSGTFTVAVEFFKVSGVTETAISSAVTSSATADVAPVLIAIPMTTTVFKIGDYLRAKITATGTNVSIGTNTLGIVGTPASVSQVFKINMPFRMDV